MSFLWTSLVALVESSPWMDVSVTLVESSPWMDVSVKKKRKKNQLPLLEVQPQGEGPYDEL